MAGDGGSLWQRRRVTGAGGAQADPPDGWQPGNQYDYGRILFTQKGWFEGRPGNYHTG